MRTLWCISVKWRNPVTICHAHFDHVHLLNCFVVEDLRGNTSGCGLHTSSLMQSKVSSVPEDEEGDEAPPITMTTQDPTHTPFTSIMIGSMTTSLWASASNVPLEPGTIDPLRVHQVIISSFPFHYVLIPIPLYPHSHSIISSFPFHYILIPIPLYPRSHSIRSMMLQIPRVQAFTHHLALSPEPHPLLKPHPLYYTIIILTAILHWVQLMLH